MRSRGLQGALAALVLVACALVVQPAAAADRCTAAGPVAVGWGGSRYVPVPPQGVGPSCTMTQSGFGVRLTIFAQGAIGGQIIDRATGDRFFCRGSLEFLLGQDRNAYPVSCSSFGGGLTMFVLEEFITPGGQMYCSTTGEVGVLANIVCESVG